MIDPAIWRTTSARLEEVEALLLQRAQEIAELKKENAILRLANPIEEDLQLKIDEALKYLAMQQGFTLAGLARLFVECQRRLADDWLQIGGLRRQLTARAQEIEQVKAEAAESAQGCLFWQQKWMELHKRTEGADAALVSHAPQQDHD